MASALPEFAMTSIAGVDRAQAVLLPELLDDYVGPAHPVRFLDAFVAQLDLAALGFQRAVPAEHRSTGLRPRRPPPALSLRLPLVASNPEEIRARLGLKAGAQFVVVGDRDVVVFKVLEPPVARRAAKRTGFRPADVARAVTKVRRSR